MSQRFSMHGRTALITGASRSIGRSIALGFAEAGADVAVSFVRALDEGFGQPQAGEDVCAEARSHGVQAAPVEGDLSEEGAPARIFAEAVQALGRVDVLVLCASVQYRAPLVDVTREQFDHQVTLNLRATVELLQHALPPMAERGWGRVLSIGSIQEVRPLADMPIYAALKNAQTSLIYNISRTHAAQGVTANNLAPGLVDTDRNLDVSSDPAEWERLQQWANPMGRASLPDEMVGTALLLCSDAGAFINGSTVWVTGGGHLP